MQSTEKLTLERPASEIYSDTIVNLTRTTLIAGALGHQDVMLLQLWGFQVYRETLQT